MVQVLPYVPSFLEQLAPHIKQATSDVATSLEQKSALKSLMALEGVTPGQPNNVAPGSATVPGQANASPLTPMNIIQGAQIAKKAGIDPNAYVAVKTAQYKAQQKEQTEINKENRASERAISQKVQEADIGKRKNISDQRLNLKLAKNAVESGEVGAFSLNSFADLWGEAGNRLKTAKGAQLDAATKSLLFDTLHDVTAKGTNLWLEKVAKSALPGLGKSREANEALITIAMGKLDLEEARLNTKDQLEQKYREAGLPIPANIEKLTDDLLKPYAIQLEDQMAYDTRVIYEKEKGERGLRSLEKVPQGTPLTLEKRDALLKIYKGDRQKVIEKAKELGYVIPNPSVFQRNEAPQ